MPAIRQKGGIARAVGLLAAAGLVLACGCMHVTYVGKEAVVGEPVSGTNHFFMAGMAGTSWINVKEICPGGVAKVHLYESFVDGLLSWVTLLIYTPRSWEVWCVGPPAKKQIDTGKPSESKEEE